ncbi:hypothetical protein SNE40_012438 [Patella caerulea]|uniref:G-protein coupled receptors family 1 profile domain-containing protein n=2 Tax=Patella caerulea TaxID=87958 RepID=A0AAN8JR98_PATCE
MKTTSMSNVTPESLVLSSILAEYNDTNGTARSMLERTPIPPPQADLGAIIGLSILFSAIVLVGIVGNGLVIFVILADRKMRQSVTNIFIMNLAIADFFIMAFGIPELVQFIMNRGWILGGGLCKFNRFTLVVSLYASVMSLVSVCVERFVAIVFPIKAHILCTRKKIIGVVACIWPIAVCCGLPTVLFNRVVPLAPGHPVSLCQLIFPIGHHSTFLAFKYLESCFFYIIPIITQVVLYSIIGRRLYASTEELSTKFQMRQNSRNRTDRAYETIRARKGVVKMLIVSVVIYFISYSPIQVHLFYNTFSTTPLPTGWPFLVFVMTMTHVNSAANPVLYCIFSQNFRRNFKKCLCYLCFRMQRKAYRRTRFDSFDSKGALSRRPSTTKTTVSRF